MGVLTYTAEIRLIRKFLEVEFVRYIFDSDRES